MTDYRLYEKIIKNETSDKIINFLRQNCGYERAIMHFIINHTDRVDMADAVLPFYKNTYTYVEICKRFLDEPDYHIDFNINNVSPEMRRWLINHSETFLKPFKIIRMSKNHDFVICEEIINGNNFSAI